LGESRSRDCRPARLLELAVDDTIPKEKIRAKLREISTERERLIAQLQATVDTLKDAVESSSRPTCACSRTPTSFT
jgi:hypothetical protein